MAVYRAEQARLSIAAEAGHGGYMEIVDTVTDATDWTGVINLASDMPAGSRSVTFNGASGTLAVGGYVLIGTAGTWNAEIRRIISLGSYNGGGATGTVFFDYPTGFWHADNEVLDEKTNAFPTGSTYTSATTGGHPQGTPGDGGLNFATFLPGVYESITTPDLTPEMLPQYLLSTSGNRNWTYMYRGKQAFTGSLSNFIMLNGYPLRFGIGTIATIGTADGSGSSTVNAAAYVDTTTPIGLRSLDVASAVGYAQGDFIQVGTGTSAEVRQIVSISTNTLTLNYPLLITHANGATCAEVTAPYTHTINESSELQSLTWNVLMRDSGETALNDYIRRYVGGMVNRMTISADEGELLRCSWDDVQFIDHIHNQTRNSAVTGDGSSADIMPKSSNMLLSPIGIGGDMVRSGSLLAAPSYPTTDPYYFSQGVLTFFGIEFARVRNFRLEVNNNIDPRYYINDSGGQRIVSEFQEQRREYTLSATIAMSDSVSAIATTRTLWKELILEGGYSGYAQTGALTGFDMTLVFTRGANDTITITSPSSSATSAFESQGCFFRRAQNSIETDSPVQVDGEIIMRNMSLVVVDSIPVYP